MQGEKCQVNRDDLSSEELIYEYYKAGERGSRKLP